MNRETCPDELTLLALLQGELDDDQRPELSRHVEDCAACASRLATLRAILSAGEDLRASAGRGDDEALAAHLLETARGPDRRGASPRKHRRASRMPRAARHRQAAARRRILWVLAPAAAASLLAAVVLVPWRPERVARSKEAALSAEPEEAAPPDGRRAAGASERAATRVEGAVEETAGHPDAEETAKEPQWAKAPAALPGRPAAAGHPEPAVEAETVRAIARVTRISGNVYYKRKGGGKWSEAAEGVRLEGGDSLDTRTGLALVELDGGPSVACAKGTWLRVRAADIRLHRGELYCEVGPGGRLEVTSPDARVRHLGTKFSVRATAAGTTVTVEEGKVLVENERGGTELGEGWQVSVRRGREPGEPRRVDVSAAHGWLADLRRPPMPAVWMQADVGEVRPAGRAGYSRGAFTVRSGGTDIWGEADGFHFVYTKVEGDGEIAARVAELKSPGEWALAGVMFRSHLGPSSPHATQMVTSTGKGKFRRRRSEGETTLSDGPQTGTVELPRWVRVVRRRDTFEGYLSPDGETWTQAFSDTVPMPASAFAGLVVLNGEGAGACTAVIDGVKLVFPRQRRNP